MFDPIPIVFVLTSLVGIIVLVTRHIPELKEADTVKARPSWAAGFSVKSVFAGAGRSFKSTLKYIYKALVFAKSEVKNSRDTARHLSQSIKHKFHKRRVEVKRAEEEAELEDIKDLEKAEEFFAQGQYNKSEEAAIELLKDNPTLKPAYEFLGKVYMAKESFLEAAEVYRYLVKQSPKNDKYWRGLGDSLVGLEDYAEAIKAYRKSLEGYPSPQVFISLGLAYQAINDYNSAAKSFESALDLEPENTQVLMLLAENYIGRNEKDLAEQVLEQILDIEPGNVVARERLMKLKI